MFTQEIKKHSQNIALVSDLGEQVTYHELSGFSEEISTKIEKRSLVFCLCENSVGSVLGYVSFLNNGVVPLLLDAGIDHELLSNLKSIYEPNYLWLPVSAAAEYPDSKEIFSAYNYSLICVSEKKLPLHPELALLLTTSGSTGSPKLVRLTYENIKANAGSIIEYLQITQIERPVTSLPMHYSYGLSVINSHLLSGATILLTNRSIVQKEFWAYMREEKASSMAGVPYTYEMLKMLRFFGMPSLPDLKMLTQAGGKLSGKLILEFAAAAEKTGRKFIVMYGQTEATARMSYLPFEHTAAKSTSIGIAIPGGQFKLMDEKQEEIVADDTDGELVYFGKNVCLGYAVCKDDLAKDDENRGVLYTGDIARRDKEGFYYITGRKKRFIKIYGNRINLDEVEQLLKDTFSDCACVGVDDKMVVFTTSINAEEKIRTFLTEKTGINNRAFFVKLITEIPKSSSGKTLYANLIYD